MQFNHSSSARSTVLIAALLAAPLGSAHAAQIGAGHAEPPGQLERLVRPSCDADGMATGTYELPTSSIGSLNGQLIDEHGEAAYLLVADLTTYLPVFDPRQARYGGIEGMLQSSSGGILPIELHVRGGWVQQPGEAARFDAEILEVNGLTGTVYRSVGLIHGSFQPGQGLAIAASVSATRVGATLQRGRLRDASPLEQAAPASLSRNGLIPPPPSQGGHHPDRDDPDVLGGSTGASMIASAQATGAQGAAAREIARPRREVFYDDLPPAAGPDREVPGMQSPQSHGSASSSGAGSGTGSGAGATVSGAQQAGGHQAGKEQAHHRILVPYDDLPPAGGPTRRQAPDRQRPDQHQGAQQGGTQSATAFGGAQAHGGASAAASESSRVLPETGLFFASWGICD